MHEALKLFKSVANSAYFEKSGIVLFFYEDGPLREKLSYGNNPIHNYFPDYRGQPNDVKAAQDFFSDKFRSLVRDPQKEVYVQFINTNDTAILNKAFASVQDMIVQRNLNALLL
jgi:guanine nucleotide-binding protein subunit alpha, other